MGNYVQIKCFNETSECRANTKFEQEFYAQNIGIYKCCFGTMRSVLGTKLFLLFYVIITTVGILFGTSSVFLWSITTLTVTFLSIYALFTEQHKYLYPFLIVSAIHIAVCISVALIVIAFSATSYVALRQIMGHITGKTYSDRLVVTTVILIVLVFLFLSIVHVWQVVVIYSCMIYFEDRHYGALAGEPNGVIDYSHIEHIPTDGRISEELIHLKNAGNWYNRSC